MYIFDGKCQKQILYSRKRKKYASDDDISSCFHSPFNFSFITWIFNIPFFHQTNSASCQIQISRAENQRVNRVHSISEGEHRSKMPFNRAPFSCTAASNWRACQTFTYILQNETNGMNGGYGDLLTVNIHKALLKSEAHRDEWAPTEKQHKKGPTFMIAHQTHSGSHQATSPWLTKSRDKVVDFMNTCLPALKSNKLRRDDIHSLPNATSKSH